MPLCPNCGTDNHDTLEECMYCGESLKTKKQSIPPISFKPQNNSTQKISTNTLISIILSLFFPFIGFILFYTSNRKNEPYAQFYLYAAVLNLIWTLVFTS